MEMKINDKPAFISGKGDVSAVGQKIMCCHSAIKKAQDPKKIGSIPIILGRTEEMVVEMIEMKINKTIIKVKKKDRMETTQWCPV